MAHKTKKARAPGHFLRAWRKHRGLSLETVTDRVQTLAAQRYPTAAERKAFKRVGATHGNLSRIERGLVPYSQILLELLADVYETTPASLIMRDPLKPGGMWTIWDQIPPENQEQAARVLETFTKKTGTAG